MEYCSDTEPFSNVSFVFHGQPEVEIYAIYISHIEFIILTK